MKTLSCKEAGMNCDFVARGKTEEEVLAQAMSHARLVHNLKEVDLPKSKMQKFRKLIHEEPERPRA